MIPFTIVWTENGKGNEDKGMREKVKKYIGAAVDWLVLLLTGRGPLMEEAEAAGVVSYKYIGEGDEEA